MLIKAPLVLAKAGTQSEKLDTRFRGNERIKRLLSRLTICIALA